MEVHADAKSHSFGEKQRDTGLGTYENAAGVKFILIFGNVSTVTVIGFRFNGGFVQEVTALEKGTKGTAMLPKSKK